MYAASKVTSQTGRESSEHAGIQGGLYSRRGRGGQGTRMNTELNEIAMACLQTICSQRTNASQELNESAYYGQKGSFIGSLTVKHELFPYNAS